MRVRVFSAPATSGKVGTKLGALFPLNALGSVPVGPRAARWPPVSTFIRGRCAVAANLGGR